MTERKEEARKEYPEILVAIGDFVAEFLVSKGVIDLDAAKAGLECAEQFRRTFGGETVYMPKGMAYELSKRDQDIIDRFDGSNSQTICREYNITRRRLYQILHAAMKCRQRLLDLGEEDDDVGTETQ